MEKWRRELYILTACQFLMQMGFSLVMPFLPLYIEQNLGISDPGQVQLWAGAAFSVTFGTAAVFSPIWGRVADRKGRRLMMMRSGFGMAITISLMAVVSNPTQLLVLRALQGVVTGFIPAAVAYMATNTPREQTGFALGLMQTGGTAGTIIGPLIGGALAHVMGYNAIFLVNGAASMLAGAIVLFFIRESPRPQAAQAAAANGPQGWALLRGNPVLVAMFVVLFLTMLSLMTAEPVLPLYLASLDTAPEYVALLSGMIFSSSGFANIFAAPLFGRLGDRRGYRRVLLITLLGSAVAYALQGLAVSAWDLLLYRFILGIFIGGTMPAANALIAQSAGPRAGQAFGLTTSASFLGNMLGPLIGSGVSYVAGMRAVFFVTAIIRLANFFWVSKALPGSKARTAEAKQRVAAPQAGQD